MRISLLRFFQKFPDIFRGKFLGQFRGLWLEQCCGQFRENVLGGCQAVIKLENLSSITQTMGLFFFQSYILPRTTECPSFMQLLVPGKIVISQNLH